MTCSRSRFIAFSFQFIIQLAKMFILKSVFPGLIVIVAKAFYAYSLSYRSISSNIENKTWAKPNVRNAVMNGHTRENLHKQPVQTVGEKLRRQNIAHASTSKSMLTPSPLPFHLQTLVVSLFSCNRKNTLRNVSRFFSNINTLTIRTLEYPCRFLLHFYAYAIRTLRQLSPPSFFFCIFSLLLSEFIVCVW